MNLKYQIEKIYDYFLNHSLVKGLINWTKHHSLPGFSRIPVYTVYKFFLAEIKKEDLTTRSNAIAFSFFLSLFPSLLVLFTVIAYLPIYSNTKDLIESSLQQIMPGNAGTLLSAFIEDLLTKPRFGLLSFGFILVIIFASDGMKSMMRGFEKSYKTTFHRRHPILKQLIAIQLTIMLGLMLIASVILVVLGSTILDFINNYIPMDYVTKWLLFFLRWFVIVALFYFGIAVIYRYGAAKRVRFPWMTPGAAFATFASLLTSLVFSFYVNNFGNYNKLYGSIGTIIVVMVWLQLNSLVILIGFELNASIAVSKDLHKLKQIDTEHLNKN